MKVSTEDAAAFRTATAGMTGDGKLFVMRELGWLAPRRELGASLRAATRSASGAPPVPDFNAAVRAATTRTTPAPPAVRHTTPSYSAPAAPDFNARIRAQHSRR